MKRKLYSANFAAKRAYSKTPKLSLLGFTNAESGNPLASCDHHCFIRLQNRLFTFSNIKN